MQEEWTAFLASQFDHVREWSLMACRGLGDDQMVTIPAGARTHVLWELGHICWTENSMVTWGCRGGDRQHPSLGEIRDRLEAGRVQTQAYIRSLSLDDLKAAAPNLPGKMAPDRFYAFNHFINHEAYHVGRIGLLRQMLGLRSVSELYLEK
jgi:hypothetical protein